MLLKGSRETEGETEGETETEREGGQKGNRARRIAKVSHRALPALNNTVSVSLYSNNVEVDRGVN